DTVFENIRYGVADATMEQVVEAAKRAYAHDFIVNNLNDGYNTRVGHSGGQLSGGQRQRIALARAILKNPRILLLDEATSQIDILSEQYIHEALSEFVGNRTTIIVTHRLTAIRLADRIIAMSNGRIEGIGTHAELLKSSPYYAGLWETENATHPQMSEIRAKTL
ncbi:MAG: ATP-binding cassette domain-containing protein, partial [Thermoguttaceae bacterium]|nr:ATP-binding cassette domain-containing protein [Thermoguttaceae bacterium]